MAQQWYYADRQRQQQGPVAPDELVAAFRRGTIDMGTLVWHERLPSWVPLAQVAAQLGIAGAPPPVPRAAPARREPPKRNGTRIVLIVFGVLFGCLIVFGGIIAAIAIPAYSDYTVRAKVMQAYRTMAMQRVNVAEFYLSNNRCPKNGDDGFGPADSYADTYVERIEFKGFGDTCEIHGALRNLGARITDGQITMQVDAQQNWTETSNLPTRYLPASMRR
jgi:type IV pilus assembly protein PilA